MQGGNSSVKDDKKMYVQRRRSRFRDAQQERQVRGCHAQYGPEQSSSQNSQEESYEAQVFGPHAACVTQAFRERLYMYDVTMKAPKPQGFVTFEVDTFDHTEAYR
jgi:hypothetical protein